MSPQERIDRFEVRRLLGQGGMGRVVEARDPLLGRALAVKTLLDPSPAARLRFIEEAQVTGQLSHPNVIAVHAFGVDGATPWLAMRFVSGRDLKDLTRSLAEGADARAYPLRRLLRLFLKVCEAVAHAHERGVVHRDLKPANVMLGADDEVLVMDWGLARPVDARAPGTSGARDAPAPDAAGRLEAVRSAARAGGADLTLEGALVGTPAYMPPEQAGDAAPDPRADVYSLGALLHELLTLRPPYQGTAHAVLTALLRGPPPAPRVAAPARAIPPAVEAIVLRAMAREPHDRYADAGALAADVEAFLDERPVSCHREGVREALARLASRHRVALTALALGTLLLVGAGTAAALWTRARADAARLAAEEARAAAVAAEEGVRAATDAEDRARRVAQAVAIATHAATEVADFAAAARTAVPSAGLERRRDALALGLEAWERAVAALAVDDDAGRDLVAPALDRLRASREALDLALLRALVARRPRRVTEPAPAPGAPPLRPGPEAPLHLARAHARLGQADRALAALEAARWPTARPDLPLAARCVALDVEDAPVAEQRAAVEEALKEAPGTAWLLGLRASLRAREGEFDQARADYERAWALDPTDAFVGGRRMAELWPRWIYAEYFPQAAEAHLVNVLAEGVDCAELRMPRREVSLWHYPQDYAPQLEALEAWKRDGEMAPARAASYQAQAALVLQRWADAERFAREALAAAPDDRRALGLLAEALVELGRLDEARDVADRGLARHPTDGQLCYARGEVARRTGDLARGARWLELGARRSMLAHRWERWARCLLELPDRASWERGVEAMREGLRHDLFDSWEATAEARPLIGDPRYHLTLGDLQRKLGNLPAAALHYRRAMTRREIDPRVEQALGADRTDAMRLGEVHEAMRLLPEAHHFYGLAREDPALADEAARRQARLEGR